METEINILACANAPFFQHLGVMLASLLANNPRSVFNVVVLTGDCPPDQRRKLAQTLARYSASRLSIRDFRPDPSLNLYTPGNYTTDNYARLWVADFFGPDVRKVLYLDSDLVIVGDVTELWEDDLGGKLMAAVDIPGSTRWADLEMPGDFGYFNSGVLVIDLMRWRSIGALDAVLSVLKRSGTTFKDVDQDALNVCFYAERRALPYKWNVTTPFYNPFHDLRLTEAQIVAAKADARIVHFNGISKPWSFHCRHPRKAEYYKHLAQTEWRDFKPADRTPIDILKKYVSPVMPKAIKDRLRPFVT